jgi:hypothetical protein
MRKSIAIAAILAGCLTTPAIAQLGPRDGTTNVTSERIGMPGTTPDALTQYQTQRAMNNLPNGQDKRALAAKLGPSRPAKSGDLVAGAVVNDNTGTAMAKIEQVDPDGVVVSMGAAKVKIPADAFGRNKAGLLLDMTRAQFEQIVEKANAS